MTNRVQTLRSSTSGNTPAAGSRLPGEIWVNFPDLQLGVIDTGKNAQKLLAVRVFSSTATYSAGDLVSQAGAIYSANGSVSAGSFNPANWTKLATMGDVSGSYVPLAGGTMTGALLLNADPSAALGAATKQYVDAHVTGFLATSGGTMTGPLTINGNLTMTGAGVLTINPSTTPGNINNTVIGASVPAAGTFTNLNASNVNFTGGTLGPGVAISGVPAPSTTVPVMDGAGQVGTATTFARGDHQHPSDSAKFNVSGGLFTGSIGISGAWSIDTQGNYYSNGGMTTVALTVNGTLTMNAGTLLYNSAYVGVMAATRNSFGATPSYVWGPGMWSGYAGGGGAFARSDRTDCYEMGFLWGAGSMVGNISTTGSSVSYNNTSDRRLKQNIRDLADELDPGALIDAIRPVAFEWRNRRHNSFEQGAVLLAEDGVADPIAKSQRAATGSTTGHGFVAQELIRVAPFAVHVPAADDDGEREVEFNFEEGRHPWGVDASKLIPYMIAELQFLRQRVAQLESISGRG